MTEHSAFPSLTMPATPFHFNFHDVEREMGHQVVIAPLGAVTHGKSVLSHELMNVSMKQSLDQGKSLPAFIATIQKMMKRVNRLCRYSSRHVKVLIKRSGHLPIDDLLQVVSHDRAMRRHPDIPDSL